MAPKRRIRKRSSGKSRINLSTKRVTKRKLRRALLQKNDTKESESTLPHAHKGGLHKHGNQAESSKHSPAVKPGRPSRFDNTEEAFLRNVPKQLREYVWKPGQSGNPSGRPKGLVSLTTRLRSILATPIEGKSKVKGKKAQTYGDEMMALAVQSARRGDYRFFQHIYERIDGKIPDHVVIEEVQQLVAQESEKLTEHLVKIVVGVVGEELGEKRGQVVVDKLTARISEQLGEKDAGRRAG